MRRSFRLSLLILSLPFLLLGQVDSTAEASESHGNTVRPLTMFQTRYRLRAGEPAKIDAPSETLDFLLRAKTRRVEIAGKEERGIAVAPNRAGDQILLAASLTMKPGEYAVTVSAVDQSGEQRTAAANITVNALPVVPPGGSTPPVVLLNGWQFSVFPPSTCPIAATGSAETFGRLATQLVAPAVYFFDNCVEQSVNGSTIEELGVTLGQFLNMIQYAGGALVPQIDLVSHSMGGLIVRSYLAGMQANDGLSPVLNPRVRKFIEIATPNFGSFLAANYFDLLANGTQAAEMVPGSSFLWSLGTWNQRGDDLRGVDAIAIIGNAGYWKSSIVSLTQLNNATDGVVSMTSAALNFARDPSRTRILPYCHIDPDSPAYQLIDCSGKGGIANVDQAPETGQIILLFLAGTSAWQSIGFSNQTQYGGGYFALENATGTQYTPFSSVSLGSQAFETGATNTVFYKEFVTSGPETFTATSTANQATTCGPFTTTGGTFSIFRCKFSPVISSVGPLLPNVSGWVVKSGGSITISGVGFGQQCSECQVVAYPGPVALQVSSWSDAAIAALLPSTFNGIAEVVVQAASGSDSITFMASPPQLPPTISLSPAQFRFSYTVGGTSPAAQILTVTNSGGGTLTWSATASASWLGVASASGTAPSTLSVQVAPTGLSAGTYTGSVQISAFGASNTPLSVTVTLTVAPAAAVLAVSPQALTFSYVAGSAIPASQSVQITNGGGGTLTWSAIASASWLSVTPASGTAPSTPSVLVSPTGLSAGTYTGTIQISAAGTAKTVTITLTVAAAAATLAVSPQALTFSYVMGTATPSAQAVSITSPSGGAASWTAASATPWLNMSPASGTTPSTLSVSVNPIGLTAGTFSGAIVISAPGLPSQSVAVKLTVTSAPSAPTIASVVNAASFLPGFAPYGWVTITGTNLSATSRTWTNADIVNGQLPIALDGVSVNINHRSAYVYYISPGQINVQAPADSLAADQNIEVDVMTPTGSTSALALERRIGPAMFMSDSTHVAAIHVDGSLVGPVGFIPGAASRPASPGETILVYMTGLGGDTSPVVPTGQVLPAPASMTDPVNATIGGQAASVQYAGMVSPGLYQLNVIVPQVANGDQAMNVQVAGVAGENTGSVTLQQ